MKKELKRLELKKLFKEYGFLKTDEEYKLALRNQYALEFEAAVLQAFKDNPDLNLLYNNPAQQNHTPVPVLNKITGLEIYQPINSNAGTRLCAPDETQHIKEEYVHEEHRTINNAEVIPEKDDQTELKKLYRKIATKTHPDKVSVKYLNDLYMKSQRAYEDSDIFTLYLICNDLEIEYDFPESLFSDFKSKISVVKKNNAQIEQTYWWVWTHEENEEKKRQLIFHFIANAYTQKFRT